MAKRKSARPAPAAKTLYAAPALEKGLDIIELLAAAPDELRQRLTQAARAFLQMWGEAIATDPVLMPLFAEQDARFRRLLADKVREGIRDGSVRADADPEAMAVSLVGLVRGIALQLISTPPPKRVRAVIEAAEVTPGPQQRFLHHVLGVVQRAEHAVAVGQQLAAVGGHQLLEGVGVPGSRGGQERGRSGHGPIVPIGWARAMNLRAGPGSTTTVNRRRRERP